MGILKYMKYYQPIRLFVEGLIQADRNIGQIIEVRPSYNGKEYSVAIKRTK